MEWEIFLGGSSRMAFHPRSDCYYIWLLGPVLHLVDASRTRTCTPRYSSLKDPTCMQPAHFPYANIVAMEIYLPLQYLSILPAESYTSIVPTCTLHAPYMYLSPQRILSSANMQPLFFNNGLTIAPFKRQIRRKSVRTSYFWKLPVSQDSVIHLVSWAMQ